MKLPIYKISLHPLRRKLGDIQPIQADCVSHIREHGVKGIPTLVVAQVEGGEDYHLLTGERWWRAAQAASIDDLPVTLFTGSEEQAVSMLKAEIVTGKNPMAIARLADSMRRDGTGKALPVSRLADSLNMNRSSVAHHLRLLQLDKPVQAMIEDGVLSLGKAKLLVRLPLSVQQKVAKTVSSEQWTVNRVKALIAKLESNKEDSNAKRDSNSVRLERIITEELGIPASITWEEGRGVLKLAFSSNDVLEGLLNRMGISGDC